ncbi:MAG: PHA/PHB synthase family protein [Bacteroidota bacterium]
MADQQGTPPQSPDRVGLSQPFVEVAERSQHIVNEWLSRNGLEDVRAATAGSFNIATLFIELTSQIMTIPATIVSAQMSLWRDYFALWQSTTTRMMGRESMPLGPAAAGESLDDEVWQEIDIFGYVKQSFLLAARCIPEIMGASETATRETLDFYTRQFLGALSASDFALGNPEVIRATIETHGENLIAGLRNLLNALEEIRRSSGARHGDRFVVGETVATTPGKVVFRNELMELIQYEPTGARVLRRPLLFVPAWVNKYYVLDLRAANSLVKWAVDQGHTVFMISWAAADDDTARKSFADYVLQGPVRALDVVEQASGETEVNAVGHCLGGTLLASTLAYLAGSGDERIKSGTFLTTMLDFSRPGELGALMNEATLCLLDEFDERGGPDARELALTANIQRENDLIWSFVVNNYLLGRDPFPFDLLHWNRDSPRVPFGIQSFYVRNLYQRNKLVEPDGIVVGNRRIDLRKVNIPTYFLAAREDHIAPWKSTYKATRLLPGNNRFTLAASGHLAGVINPPGANKYCYWTNPDTPENPEQWRIGAKAVEGSWWRDWDCWIRDLSDGEQVPARVPGGRRLKPICDAPGEYVATKA